MKERTRSGTIKRTTKMTSMKKARINTIKSITLMKLRRSIIKTKTKMETKNGVERMPPIM